MVRGFIIFPIPEVLQYPDPTSHLSSVILNHMLYSINWFTYDGLASPKMLTSFLQLKYAYEVSTINVPFPYIGIPWNGILVSDEQVIFYEDTEIHPPLPAEETSWYSIIGIFRFPKLSTGLPTGKFLWWINVIELIRRTTFIIIYPIRFPLFHWVGQSCHPKQWIVLIIPWIKHPWGVLSVTFFWRFPFLAKPSSFRSSSEIVGW